MEKEEKMGFGVCLNIDMKGREVWRSERIFYPVKLVVFKFIKCLISKNICVIVTHPLFLFFFYHLSISFIGNKFVLYVASQKAHSGC